MYLHLIHPDPKFYREIQMLFERTAPNQHIYAFYGSGSCALGGHKLPWLQTEKDLRKLLDTRSDWRGIICNGIAESLGRGMAVIPRSISMAWYFWGHEFYGLWPQCYRQLYGSQTRKWVAPEWKHAMRPIVWRLQGRLRALKTALERYDYCVCFFKEDFDAIKGEGLGKNMRYVSGAVMALEQLVDVAAPDCQLGSDIQVGNSASYSNNYPEIFDVLSRVNLAGRKVIVPLSYGDPQCRKRVCEYGMKVLGGRFEPLLEYLPLKDYQRTVQRCGTVIMNHNRQQAVGNIVAALYRGARVYMNNTSVYRGLVARGLRVELISETLRSENSNAFDMLRPETVCTHRRILRRDLSFDGVVASTQELLNMLARKTLQR